MSDGKLSTLGQMKSSLKKVMAKLSQLSADTSAAMEELDEKNADVTDLEKYLLKSGGTMTGKLTLLNALLNGILQGGAIDVHPEGTITQIAYFMNDLCGLRARGGSCTFTGTKAAVADSSIDTIFDGTSSYMYYTVNAVTDTVVITIKSFANFSYGNKFGIGFGTTAWTPKSIKWELGYATSIGGDPADNAWVTILNKSNNADPVVICSGSGPTTGGSSTKPWNTIRITLSNFASTSPRIAGIWALNYSSKSLASTLLPRTGGDVYGDIVPVSDNTRNLGSSSKKFKAIFAHSFNGFGLNKTVPEDAVFTDTVYTHPTTSGNKHIPSGGSAGKVLKWKDDGEAQWADDNDTKTTVDSSLSSTSTNPVQNKAVNAALAGKANSSKKSTTVLGVAKTTEVIGEEQLVFPEGAIFSGTAANAGLVTRGVCGVTTPDAKGACEKENLYINYDGDNTYRPGRQVVLQAGSVGAHYGNNLYQYAAARGDAVKAWFEAQVPTIDEIDAAIAAL